LPQSDSIIREPHGIIPTTLPIVPSSNPSDIFLNTLTVSPTSNPSSPEVDSSSSGKDTNSMSFTATHPPRLPASLYALTLNPSFNSVIGRISPTLCPCPILLPTTLTSVPIGRFSISTFSSFPSIASLILSSTSCAEYNSTPFKLIVISFPSIFKVYKHCSTKSAISQPYILNFL